MPKAVNFTGDPFGDDDDDDLASSHAWPTGKISSQRPTAAQLRFAAAHDSQAKNQLAAIQQQFKATSPITNRSKWKKRGATWAAGSAKVAAGATGIANTAAGGAVLGGATLGTATGWGAVAAGGLALGAGPIGLLAAATALSLGGSVRQGVSTYKTHKHIQMLESILALAKVGHFPCSVGNSPEHAEIAEKVLPYIIAKKKNKRWRKAVRSAPIVGSVETVRAKLNWVKKKIDGSQGVNRKYYAHALAFHHCESDCTLTKAIIAELFSVEEPLVEEARYCDIGQLGKLLELKCKSV